MRTSVVCLCLLASLVPVLAPRNASAADPGSAAVLAVPVSRGSGVVDLVAVDPGSGDDETLVANGAANRHPSWSPTGDRLAFASNLVDIAEGASISGVYDLFVANADGSDARLLVDHLRFGPDPATAGVRCSAWSPNGSRIAFVGTVRGDNNLYTVAEDGTGLGLLRRDFACPIDWSPDGERILGWDQSGSGLASLDLAAGEVTDLSPGQHASWTPDGDAIVYHDTVAEFIDGRLRGWTEIFAMDADGTDRRRLTFTEHDKTKIGGSSQPLASPAGRQVLYFSGLDPGTGIWALDLDGGGAHRVMGRVGGWNEAAWQPIPADLTVHVSDGTPADGHAFPLADVTVELYREGELLDLEPRATFASYGFVDVPPGNYEVRVTLEDASDGGPVFDVRYSGDPSRFARDPVWIEKAVTVPADERVSVDVAVSGADELADTNVPFPSDLDDTANIFRNTQRFVAWARRTFAPSLTNLPVQIYTFVANDPVDGEPIRPGDALYHGAAGAIVMGEATSSYTARDGIGADDGPENLEWHEFAHHLFETNVHDAGPPCDPGYTNHGGFQNPDTCDSLDEGFAIFLGAAASNGIEGTTDDQYAGLGYALDAHWKAWGRTGDAEDEDVAVGALLWDLHDETADGERTAYRRAGQEAIPSGPLWTDGIALGVEGVWSWLAGGRPATVADLHDLMGTAEPIRDVDGDGVADVLPVDEVFLMHGFFPLLDASLTDTHRTHHYDLDSAPLLGLGGFPNAAVGRTDHVPDGAGLVPRRNLPRVRGANLLVRAHDAEGRPISGARLSVDVDGSGAFDRILGSGGGLVHLPPPPAGGRGPDGTLCDPQTQITVRLEVGGTPAAETHTFDSCTYAEAVNRTTTDHAMTLDFTVPADGTAPVTEPLVSPDGARWTNGSWSVSLTCTDPEDGFASGCLDTRYTVDDGLEATYLGPFRITDEGDHTLTYASVDRAGNAGAEETLALGVDRTAPSASVLTPGSLPYLSAVPVPLLASAEDTLSGVASLCFEVSPTGGSGSGDCIEASSVVGLWTATPSLAPGTYDVTARAIDVAGNAASGPSVRITVL